MLKWQLGIAPDSWVAEMAKPQELISAKDLASERLHDLIPQDLWLYQYAKTVFNIRYLYFKSGIDGGKAPRLG